MRRRRTYKGPERRKGNEVTFDLRDPNWKTEVMRKTNMQPFSEPEAGLDLKRKQKHFIPLDGKRPSDARESGQFTVASPSMGNPVGQPYPGQSSRMPMMVGRREDFTKYSSYSYYDRRKGKKRKDKSNSQL